MKAPTETAGGACRRTTLAVALLVGGVLLSPAASAEAIVEAAPEPVPPTRTCEACDLEESAGGDRRAGTVAGWLVHLEEAGISPEAHLLWDGSRVLDGGVRERWTTRWLLQLGATFDLERLAGWKGATGFAGFHVHRGRDGSLDAGDIQAYSNIDADRFTEIDELWLEQRLLDDRVRLKVGRVDANTEFACIDAAGDFLNSSAGFSPTILTLPTYPSPEPSVNLFVEVAPRVTVGLGIYRSALARHVLTLSPDERFLVGEVDVRWDASGTGKLGIGGWHESATLERFDGGTEDGTSGMFAVFEQRLWAAGAGEDAEPARALSLFAQYGSADEDVGDFAHHYGIGLLARGPVPGRPGDVAGVMVSRVDLSDVPAAGFPDDETAWEVFWSFEVTPWLHVQPDVQYIRHPSGSAEGIDDALVGTLRVHLDF